MNSFLTRISSALLVSVALTAQVSAQVRYKVYDSGADFDPVRISQPGMIAGQAVGSFAYDRSGGLSSIPPFSGWQIWAEDVNAQGTAIGATYLGSKIVAFIWDRQNGTRLLADFGGPASYAYGINDYGNVVGTLFPPDSATAFVWNPGSGWVTLPPKYGGWCGARKINNLGEVLGYTQIDQDHSTIVIWKTDGTIIDLGNMAPQTQNNGFDINIQGYVCGRTYGPLGNVGYFWSPDGTYTPIWNPYSPGSFTTANGLNDQNILVGYLYISGVGWRGYIRYANGTMNLLNDMLDSTSQGWDVQFAYDINNKGQIAGVGYKNGQRRGVMLQPVKDRTPIKVGHGSRVGG